MSSKNIKRWITINGNHVPVYEDGTLGGVAEKFTSYDGKEHEIHAEKATGKTISDLKDDLKKNYGLEIDSADAHDMQNSRSFNDEKVTMYDKDGNEYEGTYNKYSDGGREIVDIKKKEDNSSVDDDKIKGNWDKAPEPEDKHDAALMKTMDSLQENGKATTDNAEVASQYKLNDSFSVKDNGDGTYDISKKDAKTPHIDPVSKALVKDSISIGDGIDPVPSKYNSEEQADAISYMYGIPLTEARQGIVDGKYSDDDIKRSILYQETEGLPGKYKQETYQRSLEKYGLQKTPTNASTTTSASSKESVQNSETASGIKRLDDGTIDIRHMDKPKDIPGYKDLDKYDRAEVDRLYNVKNSGNFAEFPAMERQIENLSTSTDGRKTEASLRRQFNANLANVRDTAYGLDGPVADYLNKQADDYERRFNEALSNRSSSSTPSKESARITKGVENARRQLDFDRPGEYAEISDRHWGKSLGVSNERMAEMMSVQDPKYDYEYKKDTETRKAFGSNVTVEHHRMYRVPKGNSGITMSTSQIQTMIKNIRSGKSDSQYSIAELEAELRRRKK